MSHIPASAMPHARAHEDEEGGQAQPQQAAGEPSPPEPTTATPAQPGVPPLKNGDGAGDQARVMGVGGSGAGGIGGSNEPPMSSAAPATGTGNRAGSDADRTASAAGEPAATAGASGQPSVQGDEADQAFSRRRTAGRAALALGGLAAIGGIIATVFPMIRDRDQGKGKKRGKKKA